MSQPTAASDADIRDQHEYLLRRERERRRVDDDRLITFFAFILTILLMIAASRLQPITRDAVNPVQSADRDNLATPILNPPAKLVFPTSDDIAECTKQCVGSLRASIKTLYLMGINCSYFKIWDTIFIKIGGNTTTIDCAEHCAARGWVVV